MMWFRLLRVIAHLFVGLWTCACIFPWIDDAGRNRRIQRWSIQLLYHCGVSVTVTDAAGNAAPSHPMVVSNHVSWLDIFVINTVHPCRFVAKSDIRSWPLIGWLCDRAGTIFIARGQRRELRHLYQNLANGIRQGQRIAFFPEGTTALQGTVLPFHANLFEAAIHAAVPVQPYALRYTDSNGQAHPAAEFVGDMTFAQSMLVILKAGNLHAELQRLPPIATDGMHRRELAAIAQQSIMVALAVDAGQPAL